MNSIKKVSVKDFDNAKFNRTTANQIGNNNSITVHEIKSVNSDDVEDYYYGKDPIANWSEKEPKTVDEMINLIKNMQLANVPIGVQLSIMARIVSLPYVKMVDGEGRGYGAAFERQDGPDTDQYNILHQIAVDIRKKNGKKEPEYAYGSCAQAVATLIITLFDPNYPIDNPLTQLSYLQNNSDKYQYIKDVNYGEDWGELEPGDIIISENVDGHDHIMLFVGYSDEGKPLFFEAATMKDGFSMYPIVSERELNDDVFGRDYHIYRSTVNENNSNKLNDDLYN